MKSLQFAIFLLLSSQTLFAQTIYVSPNGNDNNSGLYRKAKPYSKDGPLATLDGARIAVARQRNAGKLTGPVHVKFANGEYSLWKPVIFGPADSGTKESHVIYEADTLTASSTGEEQKLYSILVFQSRWRLLVATDFGTLRCRPELQSLTNFL